MGEASEVEQLETDLANDLRGDHHQVERNRRQQVEEIQIGLEKTDVTVDDLVLVWVPR